MKAKTEHPCSSPLASIPSAKAKTEHPCSSPLASIPSATEPREPKYQWGQRVRAGVDLYNDGSHPEHAADALLVSAGVSGEIVQTGMHVESNTPVYMVEFTGVRHVVGCLEEEIVPA